MAKKLEKRLVWIGFFLLLVIVGRVVMVKNEFKIIKSRNGSSAGCSHCSNHHTQKSASYKIKTRKYTATIIARVLYPFNNVHGNPEVRPKKLRLHNFCGGGFRFCLAFLAEDRFLTLGSLVSLRVGESCWIR